MSTRTISLVSVLVIQASMLGLGSAYADWQLVWADEFDGPGIDGTHWTFDLGNGTGGWGNNELEYYTSRPQNAYVSNSVLHIAALKEAYGGQNYTSAKLKTLGLFSQCYGRFEFRAQLPQGQGYWPALWLMPEDSVYGGWAASGEIDVMENKGSDPSTVLGTLHFGGAWPNNQQSYGPAYTFSGADSVTNFHVYALEWTTNSIQWFVDDQLYETQTSWWSSGGPYPAPFDQPFYIIMNLAVGGNFGGNPDATTVFPGEMLVDYVRVYEGVAAPAPPPVLKLKVPLADPRGSTTTASDASSGVKVTLQMLNGAGAAYDYHGLAGSGVAGAATGARALDFSSNSAQPGQPGPVAAVTNANLGFGIVSNFVVSLWFKQNSLMAQGANVGPRLFALGAGTPSDTGAANSLGLKFQTSSQLYFQLGSITASATFATNLPAGVWLFLAAVYDGANVTLYQGSETNAVSLISSTAAVTNANFGSSGALYIGNRQDRQRSFDGWISDFRFYTGSGDATFVESVRLLAAGPPVSLTTQLSGTSFTLRWPNGTLQSATDLWGPWSNVSGAAPPAYTTTPAGARQFYRVNVQ